MDVTNPEPVCVRDFARQCAAAPDLLHQYCPSSIKELATIQNHRETVVDLACKEKQADYYSGDDRLRQSVEVKFGDFIDFYHACFIGETHWLQTVVDLDFYLCQCPIVDANVSSTAPLDQLMQDFQMPNCLVNQLMDQVNLWMSVASSRTSIHYDSYQNILVVLYGRKTVTLYPPSSVGQLYAYPIHAKSANHSQVNFARPDTSIHPEFANLTPLRFDICAGDAIFIPEGWWHQVDSDAFTIAINYWFHGLRHQLVEHRHMMPYYARVLMEEMLKRETKAYLAKLQQPHQLIDPAQSEHIVESIVNATTQLERERLILTVPTGKPLQHVQELLIKRHPNIWREILADASLDLVGILTHEWEQMEQSAELLQVLFVPFDDDGAIQRKLMEKKDAHQRQICSQVMASVFGYAS